MTTPQKLQALRRLHDDSVKLRDELMYFAYKAKLGSAVLAQAIHDIESGARLIERVISELSGDPAEHSS